MNAINEIADLVVVLNLESRTDRRDRISAHLEKNSVEFRFETSYALKPHEVPPEEYYSMRYKRDSIALDDRYRYAAAALGCKYAHRKALFLAIQLHARSVLILEDDAQLLNGWDENLRAAYEAVQTYPDWQQLYLSGYANPFTTTDSPYINRIGSGWNMTAVLYSFFGMREVSPFLRNAYGETDELLAQYFHPKHNRSFIATAPITEQLPGFSDIENRLVGAKV